MVRGSPKLNHDLLFFLPHTNFGQTALDMIVAQQVQHRMDRQKRDFSLQGMTVDIRLLICFLHRDYNIPEHGRPGLLIDIILAVRSQRETEHIGLNRLIAVLAVELGDMRVVHKGHADLRRPLKSLHLQHRVATAPDENTDPGGDLDGILLVGDINFVVHEVSAPLSGFIF